MSMQSVIAACEELLKAVVEEMAERRELEAQLVHLRAELALAREDGEA
jgi:cell shape-determining protein MreC